MAKTTKTKSPRQEVKEQKRSARVAWLKKKAEKTIIGVLLVGFAYAGAFSFINHFLRSDVSKTVPEIIAAVVVAVLAIKLAACDDGNRQ